jgi:hypothetical protein
MAAVARAPRQHDIHPLLRHPRPITRDSAKAQRMLGLIADSEEKLTGLHREKSKTTAWLERPMYAHLDVSDAESEKDGDHEDRTSDLAAEKSSYQKDADLLEQSANPDRPTSFSSKDAVQTHMEPKTKLETSFNKRRPVPLTNLRPTSQHLLSPEWTVSPVTMSPNLQRKRPMSMQPSSPNVQRSSFSTTSSSESIPRFVHPQTWPAPLPQQASGRHQRPMSHQPLSSTSEQNGGPQFYEKRPRPTSFATFQHRDRRNSKIASSRGLRNDSYPNYSRPISEIAQKTVPGENIEGGAVHTHCEANNFGPMSPTLPVSATLNEPEVSVGKTKDEKKSKNRWSTIKALKNFTVRKPSAETPGEKTEETVDSMRQMSLTEQNLTWHESEVREFAATPRSAAPGMKLLPTPTYSPLEFKHPLFEGALPPPFAPWADGPPSPASSHEKRRGSDLSLSPTRTRMQSRLSVENIVHSHSHPDSSHSRHSSLGMPSPGKPAPSPHVAMIVPASPQPGSRRGTPSLERTCIICKTGKEPSAFVRRHIAGNCWHEPATCYQCLQAHIEMCVTAQGWDHCTCPECGEHMTHDDLGAFADDDNTTVRWEE